MTDTRSPEQRRLDELNLAHVKARASDLREQSERRRAFSDDRQEAAYRAGRAAGLAGWMTRGQEGCRHHERASDLASREGLSAYWATGYRDGSALRAKEQEA